MIQTSPSPWFSDFLRFWTTLGGRPPSAEEGARPDEIDRLRHLARHALPPFYTEFLLHCGRAADRFPLAGDGSSEIRTLLQWYEEQDSIGRPEIPSDCVVVGVPGIADVGHALRFVGLEAEPTFVATSDDRVLYAHARSFVNALHAAALVFRRLRFPRPFSLFKDTREAVGAVAAWATAARFQAYWFSDEHQAVLERPDAIMYVFSEIGGTRVYLQADLPAQELTIGQILCKDLQMALFS
jgi:hypothetical protein